jgi:hypothetical protein
MAYSTRDFGVSDFLPLSNNSKQNYKTRNVKLFLLLAEKYAMKHFGGCGYIDARLNVLVTNWR